VYAVDVEETMLGLVRRRAAAAGLATIETRPSRGLPIPVDDGVADLVICALVLHDLDDRPSLVRELGRIVRPHGHIAVMEWRSEPGDRRPNRLTPEQTARLLTDAGQHVLDVRPLGALQYLLVAGRSTGPP